jgi:galactose mutarotase-like enzyme
MNLSCTETQIAGLQAVSVATGAITLTLIPALGGKISSLYDQRTGREWLWTHPRMPYRQVPHGSSYTAEADTGGWDECFPSVAPCAYPSTPWQGAAIQDHGELWSQPAELTIIEQPEQVTLTTRWHGVAVPYRFERRVVLTAGSGVMRCHYHVTNATNAALPFIWCVHPLLAIEPGMQLMVPNDASFYRWATVPADVLPADRGLRFPLTVHAHGQSFDLTTLPDATAALALKLWSAPLREGWATLKAANGELRMRWDVQQVPQLAFWLNLGAWAGDQGAPYYNLGLEPCIGAQDSLAEAVDDWNLFQTVPPQGSTEWWLEVELTA